MSIPDYQSLMLPVLAASRNGEVRASVLVERLADEFGLTPEERSELMSSGQALFYNRVHWAKSYLKQAGLIEIPRRGYCKITARGQQVLESHPAIIDNTFLSQFEQFRQFKERARASQSKGSLEDDPAEIEISSQSKTPDEIMRAAHSQIEATLAQDLLDRILKAPPDFFERLIVTLLLSMGYGGSRSDAGRALGRTGDHGVDGVIDKDALGLDRVYVQAKRYAVGNNIGEPAIRDFFGSLDHHKATNGLFVTTSSFSPAAEKIAEKLSKRIVFIDGERLAKLMIRYNVGCRVEYSLDIKNLDEEFFE